jgi:hypothetical protein
MRPTTCDGTCRSRIFDNNYHLANRSCSDTGPRQPGAVTSSVGDWSVRAIQVTHRRRRSSRRAYDRRCRTGRVGRKSGLELQCTTQPGPGAAARPAGAAGLGTSGGVGPGTDVKPAHAASAGGPCRELPILGVRGARLTRGWRRYKGTCQCDRHIDGARRRSHEPTAVWPKLGLGWPESTHRWTGPPGRAASLDCSERSNLKDSERDADRARLDRVEGRDSRRTGSSRTAVQDHDVPLEANGTLILIMGVIGDIGIFPVTAQTLYRVEEE